jgi:NADH dehydrogenase FAD-containing subunit
MTSTPGLKNLVLLGLGHAHVQVLRGLAHSRPADLNLTVIAPRPLAVYSGMVPGFVAGHYTAEQCRIPLDALLARSGARTIAGSAIGIDAETRTVALASGEAVPWDWLSVNTGPIMDRDLLEVRMPGARRHALFVRPIDAFVQLWPQVAEMAASRPIHLAVVGAGAAGVELAMAASHALQGSGMPQGSHVSLVTGGEPPAAIYPQARAGPRAACPAPLATSRSSRKPASAWKWAPCCWPNGARLALRRGRCFEGRWVWHTQSRYRLAARP